MEKTARDICAKLREHGHVAYFAGGCVRDMVRGLTPKDFDVATDAPPDAVQKIFPHTYAVGAKFGVIVVVENHTNFEVATFRSDDAYIDGRRPTSVHFSTSEEDAKRRDFTINGMFFDPAKNEVIDFVDGRVDLEKKLVRAIGDPAKRFAEDRLRMLRAVRFATVLDFEIDSVTWNALVANAAKITEISAERIRDELVKIFLSPNRVRGWDLLDQSGLMRAILPEIGPMKGCQQPEQFHPEGDVFEHTRLMLQLLPEDVSVPLVFSVILHDIAKPVTAKVDETGRIRFNEHDRVGAAMTEQIMERLRFSRAEIDAAVEMVRQHMVFKDVPKMRVAKLKRFMSRPTFDEELELHRVDCAGSHQMMDNYEFLLRKKEEFANEPIIPPPLVTGDDLISLGLKPSPKFGEILEAVETRQLEGALNDRDQALEWVKKEYLNTNKPGLNMLGRFGRVLFSLAVVGIGVETLICAHGTSRSHVVPVIPWLPAIPSLAYPVGVIFVLCGAGLLFQRTMLASSIVLGVAMLLCGLAFDIPRHPDLMSASWRTNVLEPIVIGSLAWLTSGLDGIPKWLQRTSRYLIAFALIVFGIGHFQVLTFIAKMVPGWMPWHSFWTIFFGAAFIAAGISFATGFLQRWAALCVGLMFALWLITIHLPPVLHVATQSPDTWSDVFIVVGLWGGFWALLRE